MRKFVAVILLIFAALQVKAQELNCVVEVNSDKIEGTYKNVFDELQRSMSEYLNETKWTDAQFSPVEKIDCRLFLTVSEYKDDRIKGDIQVQQTRPVYNSSYTTNLLNFKDTKIDFEFREGDQLIRNDNSWDGNLTGILDFYAYLILGLDFDSFSPRGGQRYFDKAAAVVQMAQSSGEIGWRTFEDPRNRAAVLGVFTETNTAGIRDLNYNYHRKGLDEMATSPDRGRAAITESLPVLSEIYKVAPMSVALPMFRDSKIDELVNIYSKAPQDEREKVYDILQPLYPTDVTLLEKIKNPDTE